MASFAENTSVSVERSQAEIKSVLAKYGATKTATAEDTDAGTACIQFVAHDRLIKFVLALPKRDERRFGMTHGGRKMASPEKRYQMWEQACRTKWRALLLCIKAKLEAVQSGISEFESEFLANIVLPGGVTVADVVRTEIASCYLTQEPMRPMTALLGFKPED